VTSGSVSAPSEFEVFIHRDALAIRRFEGAVRKLGVTGCSGCFILKGKKIICHKNKKKLNQTIIFL
jgi:hypothetical protein